MKTEKIALLALAVSPALFAAVPVRAQTIEGPVVSQSGVQNLFSVTTNANGTNTLTNYYVSNGSLVEGNTLNMDQEGNVTDEDGNLVTTAAMSAGILGGNFQQPLTNPFGPVTTAPTKTVSPLGGGNTLTTITDPTSTGGTIVVDIYRGPDFPIPIVIITTGDANGNIIDSFWFPVLPPIPATPSGS